MKPKDKWTRQAIDLKRYDTMYLNGWDAALLYRSRSTNPYKRQDNRIWWFNGYDRCARGEALPERFAKTKAERA